MKRRLVAAVLTLLLLLSACGTRQDTQSPLSGVDSASPPLTDTSMRDSKNEAPSEEPEPEDKAEPEPESEPEPNPEPEPEPEDDGVTVYQCGPLEIPLPDEYLPQLSVETGRGGAPCNSLIRVYEKASLEAAMDESGYPAGFLFEIAAVEPEAHDEFLELDLPGSYFFAKDDAHFYVYTEPTDVQFYRKGGDDTGWEDWQILCGLGPQVRDALSAKLTPYSAQPLEYDGGAEESMPIVVPEIPETPDCPICKGSGFCTNCIGGACNECYGRRQIRCSTCGGLAKCRDCGGQGYMYKGIGVLFRKEQCSTCRGSGDCGTCAGVGFTPCYACGGSGDCFLCNGLGTCSTCNGMGKLF